MLVLIKLANLNYFYLLNVILNHMNLKSIWASSLISEYVLDLYKYLSLSQLTRALYKLILAITVYSCKWGITHISVQPYFGDCLAFPLPPRQPDNFQAKFSGHKWDKQGGNSCLGERKDW